MASLRAKFIASKDIKEIAAHAWDALTLASTHDPDHAKKLRELESRIEVLERQMERIGAPQYRTIYKGKSPVHVERVR